MYGIIVEHDDGNKEVWPGGVVFDNEDAAFVMLRVARETLVYPSSGSVSATLVKMNYYQG